MPTHGLPNIAVVGATGAVGRTMLDILAERHFPYGRIYALASAQSAGRQLEVSYPFHKPFTVQDAAAFDYHNTDLVLMSAGSAVSQAMAMRIRDAGAIVIDNSSYWRQVPVVPLVVPEVNADAITATHRLIANPNCVVAVLVLALAPLHKIWGIKRVVISTYQAISGGGQTLLDRFKNQQQEDTQPDDLLFDERFETWLPCNVIPQIGEIDTAGHSGEETKVIAETQKILGAPNLPISATCVRVPVMVGHSMSVNVELETVAQHDSLCAALSAMPASLMYSQLATPLTFAGGDVCGISRIRPDASLPPGTGWNFWLTGDNLRKGAALNAVQIAEALLAKGLLTTPR